MDPQVALKTFAGGSEHVLPSRYDPSAPMSGIETRAAQTGLSVSAYMRAAGLNHPIRSVLDLNAVADPVRVNGDLGTGCRTTEALARREARAGG